MKTLFMAISLFLITPIVCGDSVQKIKTDQGELKLYAKEKFRVSQDCLTNNCQAMNSVAAPPEMKGAGVWDKHPAAAFCEKNKGNYIVGTYADGNQDGLCRFADKSYIIAWDYYYKNVRKK